MKKLIVLAQCAILLSACNNSGETSKTAQQNADSVKPAVSETPQTQPQPEAFFSGSSDKISLTMLSAPDGSFPVTVKVNDGVVFEGSLKKEGLMNGDKPNVKSGEAKYSGVLESAGSGTTTVLSIFSGDCKDSKGTTLSHSFNLTIGDKKHSGCGSYSE